MENTANLITNNMEILGGKPVIKGTRIHAALIVEEFAGGMTMEEIIKEYALAREQIQAALRYAAMAIKEDVVLVS